MYLGSDGTWKGWSAGSGRAVTCAGSSTSAASQPLMGLEMISYVQPFVKYIDYLGRKTLFYRVSFSPFLQ